MSNTTNTLAQDRLASRELSLKTRAAHRSIEQAPLLQRLLETTLTQPQFLQIQFRFLQVYQPLEISLKSLEIWTEDTPAPNRWASLTQDLIKLGSQAPNLFTSVPVPTSEAQALGRAYVLEGSRLGGEVIRRHLETLPWFQNTFGSYFVPDQGRWRKFKGLLDHHLNSQQDISDAVHGANEGFKLIDKWMRDE